MTNTNTISRYDFEQAVENIPHTMYENYSGRGMFGSTCFGLVVEGSLAAGMVKSELLHEVERIREEANEHMELGEEVDDAWVDEQGELADLLESLASSISTDNLGFDVIVYFPGWEFSD